MQQHPLLDANREYHIYPTLYKCSSISQVIYPSSNEVTIGYIYYRVKAKARRYYTKSFEGTMGTYSIDYYEHLMLIHRLSPMNVELDSVSSWI